jgi:hypothetical protein
MREPVLIRVMPMRHPTLVRGALAMLCGYCLFLGLTATVAPHTFFADFPFLAHWVERLPPYNEHLVTDVGGAYLGFAVVLGLAAWRLERTLVLAACAGFLAVAVPHLAFHATHLAGFDELEAITELTALASLLIPPCLAIWASGADGPVGPSTPPPV